MSDIELERFKAMLRDESIDDLLTALAYKIPLYQGANRAHHKCGINRVV